VLDRTQTVLAVRQIIMTRWPHRFTPEELQARTILGEKGLGLDSIELAEVVLACEDLGGSRASAELFAAEPLTIGRVAEHFCSSPA
jgi:acyl carrier protein